MEPGAGRGRRVPSGSVRHLVQPRWGELRHGDKELYSYCWDSGERLGLFPVRVFYSESSLSKKQGWPWPQMGAVVEQGMQIVVLPAGF